MASLNTGAQNIKNKTTIVIIGILLFLGGAHAAAKCDCDDELLRPTPMPIVPLEDTPTPEELLLPVRVPLAQTICIFLVLPELQLGQLLTINAPT